jgi:hypothetical protein
LLNGSSVFCILIWKSTKENLVEFQDMARGINEEQVFVGVMEELSSAVSEGPLRSCLGCEKHTKRKEGK